MSSYFKFPGAIAAILVLAMAQQLPLSKGAPRVGENAPDFTLPIASGALVSGEKTVTLSHLTPNKTGQWILLVFYRGYW